MTDLSLDDFDDKLFLANSTTEDNINDINDKKRYIKPEVAYIEISSSSRHNLPQHQFSEFPTFTCSGTQYDNYISLYPFKRPESLDIECNEEITFAIIFKVICTEKNDSNIINFNINNTETQEDCTLFNTIIINSKIDDMAELAYNIETIMNKLVLSCIKKQFPEHHHDHHHGHNHSHNIFSISIHNDDTINNDYLTLTISSANPYKFIINICNVVYKNNVQYNEPYVQQLKQYPNTNDYCVYLDRLYSNIKTIRIIDAYIPLSDTVINSYNNEILFSIKHNDECIPDTETGHLLWKYYIPIGNYTIDEFIDTIESNINMLIMSKTGIIDNIFSFTYNKISGKFSITSTFSYTFKFNMVFNNQHSHNDNINSRSLHVMLGFQFPCTSEHEYVSEFNNLIPISCGNSIVWKPYRCINFSVSKFVWIKLNDFETIYDTKTGKYYFNKYPINQNIPIGHIFTLATHRQLHEIHISLYDPTGTLYNTNMEENRFTLEITYYLDLLQGSSISERRGIYNSDYMNTGNVDSLSSAVIINDSKNSV